MKIAIVIDALAAGGAERQAVTTAIELTRRGEHVELITYHPDNDFLQEIRAHGVKHVTISKEWLPRISRIVYLTRYFRGAKFDVVHSFNSVPSTYGRLAARLAGVPAIFGGARIEKRDGFLIRVVNRVLTPGTAGWIVNAPCVARVVIKDFGASEQRVFVVPNAISPSRFCSLLTVAQARQRFGLPAEAKVVTIIANLRPEKNHAMFLRMASRLVKSHGSLAFLLAGHGPAKESSELLCQQMGLQRHVRFLGRCSEIPDLLRATSVHVLTSSAEGIPNAVLEASCAGVPTVSTDHGGAHRVILDGQTGFIVSKEDDENMAKRVAELLDNHELRFNMGRAARRMVAERFSPESLADELLKVYRSFSDRNSTSEFGH